MPEYPSIYLLPVEVTATVGSSESVVLDPAEVAIDREAVDITGWVNKDGIDWGDAQIESYMAEAQRGQIPVDYRMPNRQIQIPLLLLERDETTFAAIRGKVQAKAALFQREGGWIKRTIGETPVFADVVGATLRLGGGSLQAWQFADGDAVLTLEAIPDWYAAEAEMSAEWGS